MKGASITDGAPKMLLARALYDNHPDCADELAFCRGDILTILEQNVPESKGWWKCLLHGRQGLAPANRLEILVEAPADRPCPPFLRGPEDASTSSQETYEVPTLLNPSSPGPVYEQMRSWVERPLPPTVQVYEVPDPPSSARIVCEKTLRFPKQALFTIPRPARTSLPALPCQVYDVPAQSRCLPALKEPGKQQQLYDILPSPQKAALGPPASQPNGQSVPLMSSIALRRGSCNTLPSPQKSEWIYDTPVSPEKADVRNASLSSFVEKSGHCALPRYMSSFHSPQNSRARTLSPHPQKNVPMQKKLSLPEIPSHSFPPPRDAFPLDEGVSYKVPSSFLISRVEQKNTRLNIYDVPKAVLSVPQAGKELGKADGPSENSMDHNSSWFSGRAASPSPEPDGLSVSSSDSRASVLSSCSSTSSHSSSSFSEESAKELPLDLDLAKETVTALQHKVDNSVAGLLLFVSRQWRFRDYLEANIHAIRRAADRIEESLREFLDFACGVRGTACNLTDSKLQAKIRDQLQTISNSYQILLETKESLESCDWSLEVLVTNKVQNSLDDLERFVLTARMVPEDIKRFASLVIANGRLIFKPNCEKEDPMQLTPNAEFKLAKSVWLPQKEIESYQRNASFQKQRESKHPPELLKKNRTDVCEQELPSLEEKETPILEQRLDENKDLETQNPSSLCPRPLSQQNPEKKIRLSEHCRLYFGALFKAIGVLHSSLGNGQPPEIFIAQSKLVIMVGQKLVDTLCQETQERDVRNEILRGSSRLCSLLKDLALATKHAVLQHPSPAALQHLQAEAKKLERHTQQFRGMLE
ncbi:cas scaffolding protein family member 4 isoform X2 [Sagmatias obliquidens]|uniref:cas scaffolding protein family member 4 isoform X2 n=1 Tax=Sagmatias obliquidens TaxID=3371155 RepID=UPI000F445AD2|nr:cas scaffolding protein family member 4 isoform X2 [Lagenorhynchus obliquidens]XP_026942744.1 cas scaffolding protein family member 4 isoform X2 [Lagenorhynchus obliquidens]